MKTRLLSLFTIALSSASFAQKPANIDYDYSQKKVIFPAIIKPLTRDDRYALVVPSRLSYHYKEDQILQEIWNPYTYGPEISARLHMVKYDYKFEVVARGMTDLKAQSSRVISTTLIDPTTRQGKDVRGYVRDFTCHFPCTLLIKNSKDSLLYSIEIASKDEVFTVSMHRDFLQADNRPNYAKPENPYDSDKELMDVETLYRDAIAKKMEQFVAYQTFSRVTRALPYLFKDYNTYKLTYGWGFVKTKNRANDYSDIDTAIVHYRSALDSIQNGNFKSCTEICESLDKTYNTILASNDARVDQNVKKILYYNLSHANLLAGHYTEAWRYFGLFIEAGATPGSSVAVELKARITQFEFRDKLQKSVKPG